MRSLRHLCLHENISFSKMAMLQLVHFQTRAEVNAGASEVSEGAETLLSTDNMSESLPAINKDPTKRKRKPITWLGKKVQAHIPDLFPCQMELLT